jgi:DNA polymerase elongation subunit (family B)
MTGFSVIDAETDPFLFGRIPTPFVWGYYNGEIYKQFDTTESLVEYISELDEIIYAHNGGKFDFHFLLEYIEIYEEIMIINGRISKMKLGNCELRDSWNIIPVGLAAYQKDEIDYDLMEAENRVKPENKREIEKYLKSDCVYLYQMIERFIQENGLCLTQAGAAMKQWKAIAPFPVPETDKEFYKRFAPFYFGGRVQCFEKGIIDADFSVYDINSAYPFAMLCNHPYSNNFSTYDHYYPDADFYHLRGVSLGALPYRGAGNSGLSFPDDDERREYFITGWEYQAAIDTHSLRDVEFLESIVFCNHQDFAEYVNKYYTLRNEAKAKEDKAGTLIYKLLMVSLYGKFAANPEEYKTYMAIPMEHARKIEKQGWTSAGEFGPWGLASAPLTEEQQHYYCVATGASITGYVRAMLWRAIKSSGRVLYCDTDSIACETLGHDIKLGADLGQWKFEGDFKRAAIAGKKLYVFKGKKGTENKKASKGVRLTEKEIMQVCRGKTVKYNNFAPTFSTKHEPVFISRNVKIT